MRSSNLGEGLACESPVSLTIYQLFAPLETSLVCVLLSQNGDTPYGCHTWRPYDYLPNDSTEKYSAYSPTVLLGGGVLAARSRSTFSIDSPRSSFCAAS